MRYNEAMKKRLIMFDMDGVLLNTEYLNDICWQAVFTQLQLHVTPEQRMHFIGIGLEAGRRYVTEHITQQYSFDTLRELREEMFRKLKLQHHLKVKSGVVPLLDMLHHFGVYTAVTSSTLRLRGERLLKASGLYDHFDYLIFGDEVKAKKPDPELFLTTQKHFGVTRQESLIIEDSYYGLLGAENAQTEAIWVQDTVDVHRFGAVSYVARVKQLDEAFRLIENMI